MTRGAAQPAVQTAPERASPALADGWSDVRADDSIQFAPIKTPEQPAEPPSWLQDLFRWLGELLEPLGQVFGASWPVVKWVLLALAVAGVLWLLWRLLVPVLERRASAPPEEELWAPRREDALALLDEADRLAAEGRYDEATHLLLRRSVGQIAAARPDWVEPSSTARELAALPALPDAARSAFRIIAERVERSLFALRHLGREDWDAARAAYAEFALQRLPGRGA